VSGVGTTTHVIQIKLESTGPGFKRDMEGSASAVQAVGGHLDETSKKASGAGKEFASLGGIVREAAANFAGYLSAQGVFMALSAAAKFAKETILGFDNEMTQSMAIMGDTTQETRKSMEGTARETAVKYNTAVADVAKGYYYLASAGYDAATSQKAIGQVTAFAKAGMFDLEKATELAADAQNAMGLKSDDASENLVQLTRITDVLTKANVDANGSVEDFAKALTNKAAAGARLAGVSLEETVSVLEVFAAQGLKGKRAGEAFTIVLRDLQDKAMSNKQAFADLGIEVYKADGSFAGFQPIVKQLEGALSGMSVEQANATIATLGFTVEGASYLKTLLGMSGELGRYEEKLKSAGGTTQEIAQRQMQSMVEKLEHMKEVAADLALSGFDALVIAAGFLGDKFGPVFTDIGRILAEVADLVAPIAKGIMMLGGAAVVGGITVLADALGALAGFLADNETAVRVLAAAGFAYLAVQATTAAAALAALLSYEIAFRFLQAQEAVIKFAIALRFMDTQTVIAGLSKMGAALLSLPAMAAAAAVALFMIYTNFQDLDKAGQAAAQTLTAKIDTSNLQSVEDAMSSLGKRQKELQGNLGSYTSDWQKFGSGMIDLLIPFHDVSDSSLDLATQLHGVDGEISRLKTSFEPAKQAIMELSKEIEAQKPVWETMGQSSQAATEATYNGLLQLAQAHDLDLTGPPAALSAELAKLYDLSNAASPAFAQLNQAFQDVADGASTAEDRIKAYQSALDALIGIHVSSAQAEDTFAASLETVAGKLGPGINLMDAYNARNREGREAVLGGVDAAMNHAVAVYNETGSLNAANGVLSQHRSQLIQAAESTGMSRAAAEQYINTLNLTPESILTLARLNKDQAAAAIAELQGQIRGIPPTVTTTAVVNVGAAEAAIEGLRRKMENSFDPAHPANRADGGVSMHAYASGGLRENHVAQISHGMRLWGEPETGGEAYIPLADSKRNRSTALLEQVAGMFGYQLMSFNGGGVNGKAPQAGVMVSSGAIQVSVTTTASSAAGIADEVRRAIRPIMAEFTSAVRTEIKGRRI
jgi:TP901 family phage tail tape measure protein